MSRLALVPNSNYFDKEYLNVLVFLTFTSYMEINWWKSPSTLKDDIQKKEGEALAFLSAIFIFVCWYVMLLCFFFFFLMLVSDFS